MIFEGILLLSMLALSIEDRYVWGKNTKPENQLESA